MANNIDERIVQMTFNNKEFEKGVKSTIDTLGDLEDALKFEADVESLEEAQDYIINEFVSSIDESLKSLEESFEQHFGVIGTITRRWTEKIADYAFDKLKDLGKLLTIQDIGAGSEKYAKQTKAVQTIVNATGKSIEDVEKVLERLMEYTDETSYDFAEMVNTIGKFTSVGVDLAVAEKAMEGIGNEAAKSGAGVSEANHAMFNFAQALSAGAVKLQDWDSIENANMATKEFKEQLISTAIELGVLEKKGENVGSIVTTSQKQLEAGQEALKKATKLTKNRAEAVAKAQKKIAEATKRVTVDYTTFTETLSSGWLTTDVLVKTLEKYSDTSTEFGRIAFESAQKALTFEDAINAVHDAVSSSWMQSNKYIFGDLNEAMDLWTRVSNALYDGAALFSDWRNELLEAWHEFGGYTAAIEAASNIWHAFYDTIVLVKDAIFSVSPLFDATDLIKWTENLRDLTGNIRKALEPQDDAEKLEETRADFTDGLTETTNESKKLTKQVDKETKSLKKNSKQVKISSKLTKSLNRIPDKKKREDNANYFDKIDPGIDDKLLERAAENGASAVTQARNRIYQLQRALQSTGYLAAESFAKGIYGPETQLAVAELQNDIGVEITGLWDEVTAKAAQANEQFSTYVGYYKQISKYNEQLAPRIKTIVQGLASISAMARKVWYSVKNFGKGVLKLFGPLIDPITRLASFVGIMLTNLNQAISKNKVDGFINGLLAKLGPLGALIKVTGDLFNDFLDGYLYFISTLPDGLKKSSKTGKTYINGAKITFASFFDYLGRLIIRNPVMKVMTGAANVIIFAVNAVSKVVAVALTGILALLKLISPVLKPIVQIVVTAGALIAATVVSVFAKIVSTIAEAIKFLKNGGSLSDVFKNLIPENVYKDLQNRWKATRTWFKEIPGNISTFFSDLKTTIVDNGIIGGIEYIKEKIKSLLNYDDTKSFGENFLGWIDNFKKSIIEKLNSIRDAFLNSDLIKTFKESAPKLYDSIVTKWDTFVGWLGGIAGAIESVLAFIGNIVTKFVSSLFPSADLTSSLEEAYGNDGITGIFNNIISSLKTLIGWDDTKTLGQNIGSMISSLFGSITDSFSNFKQKISEGDGIGAAIAGLFTDFDFGKLIIPVAIGAGGMLVTGIIRGIKSVKGTLGQKSLLGLITEPLVKNVPAVAGTVAGAFSGGLEGAIYGGGTFAPSALIATLPSLAILLGLHLEDITNFFNDALKSIKESGFWKALQEDIYPRTITYIKEKWQSFISFLFGKEGEDETSGTPGLFSNIQKELDKFITWLNGEDGIITKIRNKWKDFVGSLTFDVSIGKQVEDGTESLETPLQSLQRLIRNVLSGIVTGFGTIVELGKHAAGFAGDFIKSLKPLIQPLADFAGLVGQMFQNLFTGLNSGDGGDLGGFLSGIRTSISDFSNYITGVAASITQFLNTFISEFATVTKNGETAVETSQITFTNFISALMNAGKKAAVTVATNTADTLKPVINAFRVVFNFLIEHIDTILNFVAALGALKLNSAIKSVADTFKAFGKAMILKNEGEIDTFKESVKAITILIATLLGSFILLGNVPTDKLNDNLGNFLFFVIALSGIIAGVGLLFAKVEAIKDGLKTFSESVKDMGMGLLAMVGAFAAAALLVRIFDWSELLIGFGMIAAAVAGLGFLEAQLIKVASKHDAKEVNIAIEAIKDMGLGLLGIAGSIAILATTTKLFGGAAVGSWGMIAGIILELGGVMVAMTYFASKSDSEKVDTSVKGITSIGLAVLIISFAVRNIAGKMKWNNQTSNALGYVISIIGELGAIAVAIGKWHTGFKGAGASLAAIGLMTGAIIAIMHFIVPVINATKGTDAGSVIPAMSAIVLMIAGMIGVIALIGNMASGEKKPDVGVILAISAAFVLIGLAVTIITNALATAMPKLKDINYMAIFAFAMGIAVILGVASMIVNTLGHIDLATLATAALGIFLVLTAIGAGLSLFLALVATAIDNGLGGIGGSLSTFAGGMSSFSSLMADVDTGMLLDKFTSLSQEVMPAIILFMSMFQSEWLGITDNLKTVGGNIRIFSSSINRVKVPQEGVFDAIAEETKSFVEKIRDLGDISDVSGALNSISGAMEIYNTAASGFGFDAEGNKVDIKAINTEDIRTAFRSIKDAIPYDDIKGVADYAENGSKDLTPITTGIGAMGAAIRSYAENISALEDAPVDDAKDIIETVSGLYDDLSSDEFTGVMGVLHDKHDAISTFGTDLANLGTALGEYAGSIKGFDKNSVEYSNNVLSVVKEINTDLPTTGGFFKKLFVGEKSLGTFSSNITALGTSLASYANATAGADFSKSKAALTAIRSIKNIVNDLDKSGGAFAFFTGDKNIASIGNGLADLAGHLVGFQNTLTTGSFKYTSVAGAITAIQELATAWGSIDSSTLEYSGIGGKGGLQLLGEDLAALFIALAGGIDTAITENPQLVEQLRAVGSTFIDKIREGMLGYTVDETDGSKSFATIVGEIASGIKDDDYQPFFDLGKNLVNSIADGMEDEDTLKRFTDVAKSLSDTVAASFESNDIIVAPATEKNKKAIKAAKKEATRYEEILKDVEGLLGRYGFDLFSRAGRDLNKIGDYAYSDLLGLLNGEDNPLSQIFNKYKTEKLTEDEQAWIDGKLDAYGYAIAEKLKTLSPADIMAIATGEYDKLLSTMTTKTKPDQATKEASQAVDTAMSKTVDIVKEDEYQTFYDAGKYFAFAIADGMEDQESVDRMMAAATVLADGVKKAFEAQDISVGPISDTNGGSSGLLSGISISDEDVAKAKKLGASLIANYATSQGSFGDRIVSASMKTYMSESAMKSANKAASEAGDTLGTNLVEGTEEGIKTARKSLPPLARREMVRGPVNAANDEAEIHSPSKLTMRLGKYLMQGIQVGIKSERKDVKDIFVGSLIEAYNAAKKALGIQSPSKKTKYLGEMTVKGYTSAMMQGKTDVKSAGEELADTAIDSMTIDNYEVKTPIETIADGLVHEFKDGTKDVEVEGKNFGNAIKGIKTYIDKVSTKNGIYYYKTAGYRTSKSSTDKDKNDRINWQDAVKAYRDSRRNGQNAAGSKKNALKNATLDGTGATALDASDISDEVAPKITEGLDDSVTEGLDSSKLTKGKDIWSPLGESFNLEFDPTKVNSMFTGLDTSFTDGFKNLFKTVDENGNEVGIFDGILDGIKGQFGDLFNLDGEGGLGGILNSFLGADENGEGGLLGFLKEGVGGIFGSLFNLDDPDSPFASLGNMLESVVKKIFGLEGTVGDVVGGAVKGVGDAIDGAIGEGGLFGSIKEMLGNLIGKLFGDNGAVDAASVETGLNTQLGNVDTDAATQSLKDNLQQSVTDAVTNLGVDAETAKSNLTQPLEDSLKTAADQVDVDKVYDGLVDKSNKKLSSEINASPNLRPVIDISSITDNPKKFQTAIGVNGMTTSIDATTSATLANGISLSDLNDKFDKYTAKMDAYIAAMSQSTSDITDKFDSLQTYVSNLEIYLDSGELVGGIGPKMDNYLGKRKLATSKR